MRLGRPRLPRQPLLYGRLGAVALFALAAAAADTAAAVAAAALFADAPDATAILARAASSGSVECQRRLLVRLR